MEQTTFRYKMTKREAGHRESPMSFNELKFVHVLSGTGLWNVNGSIFSVSKDDILIFSPKDQRYIQEVTSQEPLLVEQVIFLPITVYPAHGCAQVFLEKGRRASSLLPRDQAIHCRILECFEEIRREVEESNPWKQELIVNRITSMVILAARLLFSEEGSAEAGKSPQYETVCRAVSYIHDHLGEDLSRKTIGEALYVSPSHLSRIFKEYNGMALQEYIVRCRVEHAATLIQGGVRPIDAAFESGFGSTSGFYRAFSAVTGRKPKEYTK